METDQKYVVETFIEADVTSADGSRTCHASSAGVAGVDVCSEAESLVDVARRTVRDNDRRGWLESFLQFSADWSRADIQGACARYQVRAKVHVRLAEGQKTVGECAFEVDRAKLS